MISASVDCKLGSNTDQEQKHGCTKQNANLPRNPKQKLVVSLTLVYTFQKK
jgi:hypothetical protein